MVGLTVMELDQLPVSVKWLTFEAKMLISSVWSPKKIAKILTQSWISNLSIIIRLL